MTRTGSPAMPPQPPRPAAAGSVVVVVVADPPGPPPAPVAVVAVLRLELEVRPVHAAVGELHDQLAAGACPARVGAPFEDVAVAAAVEVDTTGAARGLAAVELRLILGVAVVLARLRIAVGEDVEALEAVEAELDGHDAPGLHLIDAGRVRQAEEACEVESDRVVHDLDRLVTGGVGRADDEGLDARGRGVDRVAVRHVADAARE